MTLPLRGTDIQMLSRQFGDQSVTLSGGGGGGWSVSSSRWDHCGWMFARWLSSSYDIILGTRKGQQVFKKWISEVFFVISQVTTALIHMHDVTSSCLLV